MRKTGIILLFVLFCAKLMAQPGPGDLKHLEKLVKQYQYRDSAKAFSYARQGLHMALQAKPDTEAWRFYELLGNLSKLKNNHKEALYFFQQGLAFARQRHNVAQVVSSYRDIGLNYQAESKFTDAQQNFLNALTISENDVAHPRIGLIYDDIATIYDNENQEIKALEYVEKALRYRNSKDTLALEKALEIKGAIAYQMHHTDKARAFHLQALHLYQVQNDSIGEATMYMQIASTYDGTYKNALQCLTYAFKSKAIWDKTNPGGLYALYNMDNLSLTYWNMVRYLDTIPHIANKKTLQISLAKKAQQSFKETYRLSTLYSNSIAALFALDKLAKVEAYLGNKDAAYTDMRLYNTMHDSVYSQQNVAKIAGLEKQHDIDVRDKQLVIEKLQIANQRKETIMLIGVLVILICIALTIYQRSRNRKRVNAKLSLLNKELSDANAIKNKFFGILNHDLKRPVSDLVTFRRLHQADPAMLDANHREQYESQITDSAEHLLSVMDDLLLWSKGQMENFAPEFREVSVKILFDHIKHSFKANKISLNFKENTPGLTLYTDEHYLKTIMLNLTNNAANALSHTNKPQIEWEAWEDAAHFYLAISDNGPGADKEKFRPLYDDTVTMGPKNGLGLHIVRDMARAINCTVALDTNREAGIKVIIKIKR